MDKREILERSRRENRFQDERERAVHLEGEAVSLLAAMAVGVLILALKSGRGLPAEDTLAMFWATAFGSEAYQAWRKRKGYQAALAAVALAMLVWNLVKYLRMNG